MEDKTISEKESLELIARMIRDTQDNTARHAAYPLLVWGYATVLIAIVNWFLYLQEVSWNAGLIWFALPLIAGPITFYISRKYRNSGARNYIDRVTSQIWIVFGTVGFFLSCFSFFCRIDILFVISLMMGMGATLTGLVIKYNPLALAGAIGTAMSLSMLFVQGIDKLLVFAVIFVVMMIIPGHIMNNHIKRCLKN